MDNNSVPLSHHPCYAGLKRIEVLEPDTGEETMFFQIVEGCGYDVYSITADEADKIVEILQRNAKILRGKA